MADFEMDKEKITGKTPCPLFIYLLNIYLTRG